MIFMSGFIFLQSYYQNEGLTFVCRDVRINDIDQFNVFVAVIYSSAQLFICTGSFY